MDPVENQKQIPEIKKEKRNQIISSLFVVLIGLVFSTMGVCFFRAFFYIPNDFTSNSILDNLISNCVPILITASVYLFVIGVVLVLLVLSFLFSPNSKFSKKTSTCILQAYNKKSTIALFDLLTNIDELIISIVVFIPSLFVMSFLIFYKDFKACFEPIVQAVNNLPQEAKKNLLFTFIFFLVLFIFAVISVIKMILSERNSISINYLLAEIAKIPQKEKYGLKTDTEKTEEEKTEQMKKKKHTYVIKNPFPTRIWIAAIFSCVSIAVGISLYGYFKPIGLGITIGSVLFLCFVLYVCHTGKSFQK